MSGLRALPVLTCTDPETTAEFLTQGLGFRLLGWRRDAEGRADLGFVRLGGVALAVRRGEPPPPDGLSAIVFVDDARDLAAFALGQGIALTRGPEDTPRGCREVEVIAPEGHVLLFAEDLAPGPEGPGF